MGLFGYIPFQMPRRLDRDPHTIPYPRRARRLNVNHTRIKSYRYRIGKNQYIVIQIYQRADAHSVQGNALASNALNIQISKQSKRRR